MTGANCSNSCLKPVPIKIVILKRKKVFAAETFLVFPLMSESNLFEEEVFVCEHFDG
jgi:hypothetical protein